MMAADDPSAVPVAVGRAGQTAWQFIGTINQRGVDFTMSGYLTSVSGLTDAQLFSNPDDRSAETARFKVTATGKMTGRNAIPPLFVLNSVATTSVGFGSGPAAASVATFNSELQTVIDVTAPQKGQFTASGDYVRTGAENFVIDGVRYRFGEANRAVHVTMSGDGTLADPTGPVATIIVAGRAVIGDYLPQP
jgi:hypothetical protein